MLWLGRSPCKPANLFLVVPGSSVAGTEDGGIERGTCRTRLVTMKDPGRVGRAQAQDAFVVPVAPLQGHSTDFAFPSSSVHLRRRKKVAIFNG